MCTYEYLELFCVMLLSCLAWLFVFLFLEEFMLMKTYRGEERLLGVIVQFHLDHGGWFWLCPHCEAELKNGVRYGSRLSARVAVMARIFAVAIDEECSAVSLPPPGVEDADTPASSRVVKRSPSQGGDGGR